MIFLIYRENLYPGTISSVTAAPPTSFRLSRTHVLKMLKKTTINQEKLSSVGFKVLVYRTY